MSGTYYHFRIRADDSVRLEREATFLTNSSRGQKSLSASSAKENNGKRKESIATGSEDTAGRPEPVRKTSTVSFKDVPVPDFQLVSTVSFIDVPDDTATAEVPMRDTGVTEANIRLTTDSSLPTASSFNTDDDSLSCQEFNASEIDELRKSSFGDGWFLKSKKHLTKTEKKLRREQAMQTK